MRIEVILDPSDGFTSGIVLLSVFHEMRQSPPLVLCSSGHESISFPCIEVKALQTATCPVADVESIHCPGITSIAHTHASFY